MAVNAGALANLGKNSREKRYRDKYRPLRNPIRQEEIRSIRHAVREAIKEERFEQLDVLELNKLEREE